MSTSAEPELWADLGGRRERRNQREAGRSSDRRGHRALKVVLGIFVVMVLLMVGAAWWLMRQVDPPGAAGPQIRVTVPRGASTSDIAQILADKGIVSSGTLFQYYVKYKGADTIEAGQYLMHEDSSMGAALAVLKGGPAPPAFDQVTIPEGYSLWASAGIPVPGPIVHRLDGAVHRFTTASITKVLLSGRIRSAYQPAGVTSLEGLLFPDTYRIGKKQDEASVLHEMVHQFDTVANHLGYRNAQALTGHTPYEAIVVASLVEREAGLDEDRAKIARVIYNRLDQGIPLGIDASIAYAVGGAANGTLTASQLRVDSPYNTRTHQGLPPTPIAVPGRASLQAALHPATGNWIYYVLQDHRGSHFFTASYQEFLQAKDRCRAMGLC